MQMWLCAAALRAPPPFRGFTLRFSYEKAVLLSYSSLDVFAVRRSNAGDSTTSVTLVSFTWSLVWDFEC